MFDKDIKCMPYVYGCSNIAIDSKGDIHAVWYYADDVTLRWGHPHVNAYYHTVYYSIVDSSGKILCQSVIDNDTNNIAEWDRYNQAPDHMHEFVEFILPASIVGVGAVTFIAGIQLTNKMLDETNKKKRQKDETIYL